MGHPAKLGVCGICGHSVMRALDEPRDGTINGHTFKDGKPVRVRCRMHGGSLWEPEPGVAPYVDGFLGYIDQPLIVKGKE